MRAVGLHCGFGVGAAAVAASSDACCDAAALRSAPCVPRRPVKRPQTLRCARGNSRLKATISCTAASAWLQRRGAPLRAAAAVDCSADWSEIDGDVPTPGYTSVPEALEAIAAGRFVVVMDDEDRENEGDLIIAADRTSTEAMAFMIRHTSGVVCVALENERADTLKLPLMVDDKARCCARASLGEGLHAKQAPEQLESGGFACPTTRCRVVRIEGWGARFI